MTEPSEENWYIVKQISEQCAILSAAEFEALGNAEATAENPPERWGPFKAKNQAIAKRVGLIRAGKCQPIS